MLIDENIKLKIDYHEKLLLVKHWIYIVSRETVNNTEQ